MRTNFLFTRLFAILIAGIAWLMPINKVSADNNSPLCFTAKNGSVTVRFEIKNVSHTIQYSTDSTTWNTYTSNTNVNLNANQKVYFQAATNQTYATAFGAPGIGTYSHFSFTTSNGGTVEGTGNIMSLYGPDCPNLPLQSYAFYYIFKDDSILTSSPSLPAIYIGDFSYSGMFAGCTSLTLPPSLPATTTSQWCYSCMFEGCSSLLTAPILPAMTLTKACYAAMFRGCSSLTTAPSLPATTMATHCYAELFSGCTSLTIPPILPATTLANYCYCSMFRNCTSLTTPPALPATNFSQYQYCYESMFEGCTSLATAPALPATIAGYACYQGMFKDCTSLTIAPSLPATTLQFGCYQTMFMGCTSLTTIPQLPATTLISSCYRYMFYGCSSLIVNTEGPGTQWIIAASNYYDGDLTNMFSGTGGTMNGTPSINTTYYVASDISVYTIANGDWNDANNWSGGNVPNSSNNVSILNNVTIPAGVNAECAILSIEDGELSVVPSATLQADSIHNTDPTKLIIQSNQYNTATVHFSNGSPKATVQMCFKGTFHPNGGASNPDWQYRGFIGTPDGNQKLQDIVAFKWDEMTNASSCWGQNPFYNGCDHSATASFEPWSGYSMANYSSANTIREYTTTLTPIATPKSYTMSRTTVATGSSTSANCGVNLLTNSYSAPINLSDPNITFNNAENTVYFFNTRTYNDYNDDRYAAVTAYPTKSGYAIASTPYIPAGQSFAVKATADGATLTIPTSALSTVSSGAMYAPAKKEKFGIVKITVESDDAIDEVYLLQSDECTSEFDNGYDGTKMFSTKAHQIYAQNEYGKTAVNADKTLLGQYVGFKPMNGTSTDVTLWVSARDLEGYDKLYLYDYVTDTYTEITDSEVSYTFTSTGEENSRRFQIVGKAEDGTEYKPKAEPRIEVAGNEIYLMNFERADAMIILSDATGRTLWSVNAKNGNVFTLPELAKGVYLVSCGKVSAKYVQR